MAITKYNFSRDIFGHNIAIKNVLIFLRHRIQCPAKVSSKQNVTYPVLRFVKSYLG